jgi:integrase
MASIRKRNDTWFAEIRLKGYPPQRQSFQSQAAARAWARKIETSMDTGSWIDTRATRSTLIDSIVEELYYSFERFGIKIASSKKCQLSMLASYFKGVNIHDLTVDDVLDFAAMRRKTVTGSTLQKQLYYLRQAVNNSRIRLQENVVQQAIDELSIKKLIMKSRDRDRRLEIGEYELLKDNMVGRRRWIGFAMDLALETGMRQGEIHALRKQDIDFDKKIIRCWRKDKTQENSKKFCEIPLFTSARAVILREQKYIGGRDNLIHVRQASSISDAFAKVCDAVGIEDLHFHDLRHEAISRMFEIKKMQVEEVRLVSGHSSLDQLSRYVNLRAENLAD